MLKKSYRKNEILKYLANKSAFKNLAGLVVIESILGPINIGGKMKDKASRSAPYKPLTVKY